jgi:hypothetical protein
MVGGDYVYDPQSEFRPLREIAGCIDADVDF